MLVPAFVDPERDQVALVAVQRLRVLRRHGGRARSRPWSLLFIGRPDYMTDGGLEPIRLHPVYVVFPTIMVLSAIASIGVCLLTRPEEDAVLMRFYRTVRPWGFWRPIYEKCRSDQPGFQRNPNLRPRLVQCDNRDRLGVGHGGGPDLPGAAAVWAGCSRLWARSLSGYVG